jgi:hypothetical protein
MLQACAAIGPLAEQNRNSHSAISAGASWINKMLIGIALGRLSALR